jgi:uncharacterized DUF497 family protein
MAFEWDEEKRRRNIKERGVDFLDAALILKITVLRAYMEAQRRGERH